MLASIVLLSALTASVAGQFGGTLHTILVGNHGALTYTPPFINAAIGDVVQFKFTAANHTITQSTFASPCSMLPNGLDSGFQPVAGHTSPPISEFLVASNESLWFYCRQTGHCQKGMVFAVNPDASGHNFQEFLANAEGSSTNTTQIPPPTGVVHNVKVGDKGGLTYTPPYVTANVGDEIKFTFEARNHTVTQSSFAQPCKRLIGPDGMTPTGFDTGFMPVPVGQPLPTASFIVPSAGPLWFYCRQTGHCAKGMVFAVNPAPGTFDKFLQTALETGNTTTTPSNSTVPVVHNIVVASNKTLTFTPSNITANVGDMIHFTFAAGNHTVTQSSFLDPCVAGLGAGQPGFDSGFMPVSAGNGAFPTFVVTISDKNPVWVYCKQRPPIGKSHCQSGMVFSVNADPNSAKSFAAFQSLAESSKNSTNVILDAASIPSPSITNTVASLQAQVNDLTKDRRVLAAILGGLFIVAILVAIGALIALVRRRRANKGAYTATNARDYDIDNQGEARDQPFLAPIARHQPYQQAPQRESVETLRNYNDEDEKQTLSSSGAEGTGYSDPYDPPHSALGSYTGR